jgi:YegS/Rv2252/BmrU family lipid kinase
LKQRPSRFGLIVNPTANRDRARHGLEELQEQINLYWPGSRIYLSSGKEDLGRLTREINEEFDGVIACGGDGTISEVARHAHHCGTLLGVLPMGSGNDFAKSAGMSLDRRTAMKQLSQATETSVDIVAFTVGDSPGYMVNTMGIGLNGEINRVAAGINRVKGPLLYVFAAIRSVLRLDPFLCDITADGVMSREELIMITVANGHTEGGSFRVAPEAQIHDGVLELITIRRANPVYLLFLLPFFFFGKQFWSPIVRRRVVRTLQIKCERPVPIHVDGEQIDPLDGHIKLSVLSGGLRVLMGDHPKSSET